ncbi:MAG: hypothetical protein ACU85E_12700 [Gammaproteobacteria bacterium]
MPLQPLLLLIFFIVTGCQSTFGPRGLENTHPAYNQAIAKTLNEQMLLNLVRSRYRDNPYFLDVGSVTASLSLTASAGVNTELDLGPNGNLIMPNIGFGYSQTPTLSYTPLRGEDFLKSILSPIPLESLLVMTQSGWSIERVFGICLERINDLNNAPSASGPTPDNEPDYRQFRKFLSILRELQTAGVIEMGQDMNSAKLQIQFTGNGRYRKQLETLRDILHLDSTIERFNISSNFLEQQPNQWNVRTRSIAGILFYLSQTIEIPEAHQQKGWVNITHTHSGYPFQWRNTPAGELFLVKTSQTEPDNAAVSVFYRGTWFYIADNDLQSKSTFMLLLQLFNLQAGQTHYSGPTLTLPVGGR